MPEIPAYLTFKQFAAKHPAWTEASLRWLRFNCATNGFASAMVKVQKRVLIDEGRFFELIEEQNRAAGPEGR